MGKLASLHVLTIELLAQHAVTLVAACCALSYRGWLSAAGAGVVDDGRAKEVVNTKLSNVDGRKDNFSCVSYEDP